MKRYLFAACFALLLGSAQANALYILFEPYCMDRLEYVYANQEGAAPHIAYHINVTPAEKIILDIGVEDKSLQPNLPAQVMRCNSGFFDQRLVNDINSKIRRVYIVVKMQNDSYLVAPVLQAARYLRAEDFLAYDSPDYRFEFDLKMGVIGENIALSNPGAKVFFQGKLHNECSGALLFRQIQDGAARPRTDLTLVPELGLVEIRNGINADDAMNNALRLTRVNNRPAAEYLRLICNNAIVPAQPASNSSQDDFIVVGGGASTQERGLPQPQPQTQPQPQAQPQPATHAVAKGETLFRISKKYGVTVAQLQQWNNKGNSTTIFPGEQLRVAAQAANPAQTSTAAAASSDLAVRTGAAVQTYTGSDASRLASDDIHVAAPGETVASVALRYGYTEARFRQLNNLSPTQVLRVGQVLRTSDCPTDTPAPAAQPSGGIPATTLSSFPAGMTPRSPTAVPTDMSTDDARRPRTEIFYYNLFDSDRPSFRDLNTPNFTNGAAPSAAPTSTTVTPRGIPSPAEYNAMPASRASSQAMPVDLEAFLPKSYDAPAPQQPVAQSQRPTDRAFYVVQQGDSLYRIARMYGVTVEHLCAVNDFSPREAIIPGQKIFIQ